MMRTIERNVYLSTIIPVGFFVIVIAIGLTPGGGVLNFVFAPLAAALALLLLLRQPTAYLSFVMWTWMLTPFVRRLTDSQSGYREVSIVMIAPLMVTALAALTPLRFRQNFAIQSVVPYFFYLIVLLYGFFVGALNAGLPAATLALANWAVPAILALHVMTAPEAAEEKARAMLRALVFGTLVIGGYGVFQFVLLPSWDADWMISSGLKSIGHPFPFQVRVFGTLNSPGPYAIFTAAGIVAGFATRSKMRTTVIAAGAVGLMLSLVRSSWGGWLIGMMVIFVLSPLREKNRLLVLATIAVGLITPVVAFTPLGEGIIQRIATLGDTENDSSFAARQALYTTFSGQALSSVVGVGLGKTGVLSARLSDTSDDEVSSIDSGFLEAFYTFGLLASILFGSILAMVITSWPRRKHPLAIASMGVAMSVLPTLVFGNSLLSATGMLILPFLALGRLLRDKSGDSMVPVARRRVAEARASVA